MNRNEVRTLGRLGQPLSGGSYRPRRRLRAPRWLTIAVGVSLLAILWVGVAANRQVDTADSGAAVAAANVPARPGVTVSRGAARTDATPVFATVDGLNLVTPHGAPVAIGFHEANRVEALELLPIGTLLANDNPDGFEAPTDMAGPEYRILSTRGRARPATSAVDVVVPLGDNVRAPVSGTVTRVTEYPLSGRIRDWRVEITPEGRPDLTVVMIHLLKPSVDVGDTVVAGDSRVAVARLLPFDSHVDYVTKDKQPHTHIEVKPAVEAGAIDPNAPALPADAVGAGDS